MNRAVRWPSVIVALLGATMVVWLLVPGSSAGAAQVTASTAAVPSSASASAAADSVASDAASWLGALLGDWLAVDSPGWQQVVIIATATLVSEDLTALGAGLLAQRPELPLLLAVSATALGIWLGDLGLFAFGRFGRLGWFAAARLGSGGRDRATGTTPAADLGEAAPAGADARVRRWQQQFAENAWVVILASRFIPGTRLPLYTGLGACGASWLAFAGWTALAVALWTPLIVVGAWWFGGDVLARAEAAGWPLWLVGPLVVLGLLVVVRLVLSGASAAGRRSWSIRFQRWRAIEFWPSWAFYLPIVPWCSWLSLREGHPLIFTTANPCIPQGGVVGESKSAIQGLLPPRWTIPGALVPAAECGIEATDAPDPAAVDQRLEHIERVRRWHQWSWPLILKPDAGQRGVGVKLVADAAAARAYLRCTGDALQVQPWHPGPYEVGLFYYRLPGAERGRVLAVTEKIFPELVADGKHTLEQLVAAHPRYRLQADVFAAKHAQRWQQVIPAGERVVLTRSGNHAQGTLFRDGGHLLTAALEARVDSIARAIPGFYFGRFDIRYSDPAAFAAGTDLAIVELNGVTSECTNIYDPDWPRWRAWRLLAKQWTVLVAISHVWHYRRGHPHLTWRQLIAEVRGHYAARSVPLIGD